MTERKFTDEQIIEALEVRMPHDAICREAYDLIMRQRAEIERLEAIIDAAEEHFAPLPFKNKFDEYIEKSKAKAIKEFAERVKENLDDFFRTDEDATLDTADMIDTLVKEMTEGKQ